MSRKNHTRGCFIIFTNDNNNIENIQCTDNVYTGEILKDESSTGKERPWKDKKISNINYAELLYILEMKKFERVKECAQVLEFQKNKETNQLKLYRAWFCKSRLCAICNWRRTMKHSYQSTKIVKEVIKRKPTCRWVFVTLTVKNVYDGEELDKSLRDLSQGFNRLVKYKKVNKNLIGFMRATEVTVNHIDNSYNQHIHVLMCVKSTYFHSPENYITQKELIALWRKAMKLNYDPIVDIRAIRRKNRQTTEIHSAISEVAKYPVKDTDYMTNNQELNVKRVKDLEEGLNRKRLIAYGGLLRKVHKELNLDELEDGDLIHVDEDEKKAEENAYSVVALWNWNRQNYFIK